MTDLEHKRNLTDADIEALASKIEARFVSRFYRNLGSGVWDLAWKAIVLTVVVIAAWGAWKSSGH